MKKNKFTQRLTLIQIGKPDSWPGKAPEEKDKDGSGGNPKNKYCIQAITMDPIRTVPITKSMYGFIFTKKLLASG